MSKVVTTKQIQELDRLAIGRFGLPSLILMENAGRAAAQEILFYLKRRKNKKVSIVCGVGNNGGDGFVIARYLLNAGVQVNVFVIGKLKNFKSDALINYLILKKLGIKVRFRERLTPADVRHIHQSEVIVDSLFGVGLNRLLDTSIQAIIAIINREDKYVIAVDVPSGLDATTGKIWGNCIRADETITFTYTKKGFYIQEGPAFTGKIKVVDIGIPEKIKKAVIK